MSKWPKDYRVSSVISDCGIYRYSLEIAWNSYVKKSMGLVMLNPSTADDVFTDPTAIRSVGFAEREGFDSLEICNIYAYRATKPKELFKATNPEGAWNLKYLSAMLSFRNKVVVGWGNNLGYGPARQKFLLEADKLGSDLYCLGITKSGEPRHPLYLPKDSEMRIWRTADYGRLP